MKRPSYTVVTSTTVTLAVLGLLAVLIKPLIPPPPPNRMASEKADYLARATFQEVDWHPFEEEAFAEARRRGLPVLLTIGCSWSQHGRGLDKNVFMDGAVRQYLNRNFVPVRIDGSEMPEWVNAYLPLRRSKAEFMPGVQMWILDPNGRAFDFIGFVQPRRELDSHGFIRILSEALNKFEEIQTGRSDIVPGADQQIDREVIRTVSSGLVPDFKAHRDTILVQIDQKNGGLVRQGYQVQLPNSWRYLLLIGNYYDFSESMDAVLDSPVVDHLYGGFFRLGTTPDWEIIQFDKVSTVNAEMMLTLALAERLTGNGVYKFYAQRTFDYLAGLYEEDGLIGTCVPGPMDELNRSQLWSYSPRRLRTVLKNAEDREWAAEHLHLKVQENPQMIPYISNQELLVDDGDNLRRILASLRESNDAYPRQAGLQTLSVNGFVIARMIEVARMWGDEQRLQTALGLTENLERFRFGERVVHDLGGRAAERDYLGDYLAYADAVLQDYLASGRVVSLNHGSEMLTQALDMFEDFESGVLNLTAEELSAPLPTDTRGPEIVDNISESCTAMAIRLLDAYGNLLSDREEGQRFLEVATEARQRFATVSGEMGTYVSGYFCACAMNLDDAHAITVGLNAQELSNELFRKRPTRLVAPAFGDVRPDLQNRGEGVYIVEDANVRGPFSVDEAAGVLAVQLNVR